MPKKNQFMNEVFRLRLDVIQPSQLYISRTKFDAVMKYFETSTESQLEPIPVKRIDDMVVSTDGHTRGVAWHLQGYEVVDVVWEDLEMDWDEYRVYVDWCKEEGITSMCDLSDRFLDHSEYEILWLERCRIMQEELENQRKSSLPQ